MFLYNTQTCGKHLDPDQWKKACSPIFDRGVISFDVGQSYSPSKALSVQDGDGGIPHPSHLGGLLEKDNMRHLPNHPLLARWHQSRSCCRSYQELLKSQGRQGPRSVHSAHDSLFLVLSSTILLCLGQAGFFRFAAYTIGDAESWHNYAACRQLVYGDFEGATQCYLKALDIDPRSAQIEVKGREAKRRTNSNHTSPWSDEPFFWIRSARRWPISFPNVPCTSYVSSIPSLRGPRR